MPFLDSLSLLSSRARTHAFVRVYGRLPKKYKENANSGCILSGGLPACRGKISVYDSSGVITIYGQFSNNHQVIQTPGCKLQLSYPSNFGDIYYGANNCMYDANGFPLPGTRCCTQSTSDVVDNPYYLTYSKRDVEANVTASE
ncbi:hypothetical protein B0H63DRAFT_479492 [Podospora didyma]|uniref:Uncharacterized protein n=1 Tax=Podospora didyma TaxID=330526 RepID=A0AAE0KL75_9PEZI|nr:hypothetical protein B0H63DRAFT_479492 [Podospora didyma]